MALNTGARLGPYEITGPLGAGGMGEVYRARDSKLNRDVAIKVLPAAFADDAQYMARFEREAQTLAALNHPNIATVFGIEQGALVMELVEGPTLADRIARGPLPLDEALPIARQIAEGLEAAHERGIVHRDLKPANVKITPAGAVKILDFGLAKTGSDYHADAANSVSPTLSLAMTQAGYILGTAAYMSPEQARGKPVDKRTDIWAYGVVLWEMLTGRTLFGGGETVTDTLASVVKENADLGALPPETPFHVRRLIERCLRKDARLRLRDIGEARLALDETVEAPPAPAAAPVKAARWPLWGALAAIPIAALLGWQLHRPPPPTRLPLQFDVTTPAAALASTVFAISPDGRQLAQLAGPTGANTSIWIRDLGSSTVRQLPGTERAVNVFWSPDGRSIGFVQDEKLKRIEAAGGPTTTVCALGNLQVGGIWGEDGFIVFGQARGPLMRVPSTGGVPAPLTKLASGETAHTRPVAVPGGRFLLFRSPGRGIFVTSPDGRMPPRRVFDAPSEVIPAVHPSGGRDVLLYRSESALMAVPFDSSKAEVTGDPFQVANRIPGSGTRLAARVSVPARVLVLSFAETSDALETVALDRRGERISILGTQGADPWQHLELSPDGARLLGNTDTEGAADLWALDLKRNIPTRITTDPAMDVPGAWSADGRRIFYASTQADRTALYAIAADGSGKPELLLDTNVHHLHASADGRLLAFEAGPAGAARNIVVLALGKDTKPEKVVEGGGALGYPQFSPDGRWLAFVSDQSGRREAYVQSHPPGKGRWQVSREGANQVRWRRDGRELVYGYSGAFHSVAVANRGEALEFGAPVKLFQAPVSSLANLQYFAMSGDARTFYMNVRPSGERQAPRAHTVRVDWLPPAGR